MIKVLIVDDSPFIRIALRKILSSAEDIEVIGEASNGKEAVELVGKLKPDVVTLDINMPIMDGLEALENIMRIDPQCRVLMVSALTKEGARETIEALNKGAVDFITKPTDYKELFTFREEILGKVRAVYQSGKRVKKEIPEIPPVEPLGNFDIPPVIAIGISTGGPQTLNYVLPSLPENFPSPVLIAIHMPDTFTATFARHLNALCKIPVSEAKEGEILKGGKIYISRGRIHMTVEGSPTKAVIRYREDNSYLYKPSADLLLISCAKVFKKNTVGVIMTGMGNDGSRGIVEVKKRRGVTVAEDPRTAILWAMPENAIKTGCVDHVVPKEKMAQLLIKLSLSVKK